jgi:tRNA/rRNA methyltransferase
MSNFGLLRLRIVAPRNGWPPSKEAYVFAAAGSFIVQNAEIYEDLHHALADLNFVVAATARTRKMEKKISVPREVAKYCATKLSKKSKVGIMFGRENNGLSNEELGLADVISMIQTSDINPSLNLAQAVAIFAYEFFCVQSSIAQGNCRVLEKKQDLCSKEEFEYFFNYFSKALEEKKYFKDHNIKKHMMKNMKNLFVKSELTKQEVNTLMGAIKALYQ